MSPLGIALIAIVVIVLAVAIWILLKAKRTKQLQSRFGPEYQRAVRSEGTARAAEKVLEERQQRVAGLEITPLDEQQRTRFAKAWEDEQAHFVDEPRAAVDAADRLVGDVMKARGYPVTDFEQRVADVSVDHPVVVENYRVAHGIALKDRQKPVSTEELRQAMIHYRALFADLLHDGGIRPVRNLRSDNRELAREAGR
jgi:hypothetical protein